MDYEKEYNEALERAKKIMNNSCSSETTKAVCQEIFPGIADSEDERIRKSLIGIVEQFMADERREKTLAWLEKQKERGPLTEEEEYILHRIIEYLEDETCPTEWISLLHDIYCLPYEKPKESHFIDNFPYSDQKEQKPAEKQDYSGLNDCERAIHCGFLAAGVENVPVTIIKETAKECLAQMKPAGWSDSVAKEMFIKALERAVEQTKKGYELTDCDKHSWWEDFKACSEIKPAEWSLQDARPGDVLTTGAVTFIFKSANGDFANAYCYFSEMTGKFDISETAEIYLKYVQPASVEQRVRLYEHLLRYIRIHTQEEHWKPSEEDEKILHAIELHINQLNSGETINGFSSSDMLRVLKSLNRL